MNENPFMYKPEPLNASANEAPRRCAKSTPANVSADAGMRRHSGSLQKESELEKKKHTEEKINLYLSHSEEICIIRQEMVGVRASVKTLRTIDALKK